VRYRLADGAIDYTLCRELAAAEGFPEHKIDFPTVMAVDDDNEVIGFLATQPKPDMVLAGPMVLRHDKRRPFTAIQMIQLYEMTMRSLGISSVIFHTIKGSFLSRGVGRYFPGIKPYSEAGEDQFFIWPLTKQEAINGEGR
jgi:hypothetical protein